MSAHVSCPCTSGATGYAQCSAAGDGYGACDCTGASPITVAAAVDAGDSGLVAFMQPCERDDQCATGCFPFNAKGPKCSKKCATSNECPPPASGCNNQGVCKAP